jgi:hypothetical protein
VIKVTLMTSSRGHDGLRRFPYNTLYAALLIGQALLLVAFIIYGV